MGQQNLMKIKTSVKFTIIFFNVQNKIININGNRDVIGCRYIYKIL